HFSGKSYMAKMDVTGQTGTHAPQSMHSSGMIESILDDSKSTSSLRGWMQSTGQTSTQAVSLVPMQGSAITYAMRALSWTRGLSKRRYISRNIILPAKFF